MKKLELNKYLEALMYIFFLLSINFIIIIYYQEIKD